MNDAFQALLKEKYPRALSLEVTWYKAPVNSILRVLPFFELTQEMVGNAKIKT